MSAKELRVQRGQRGSLGPGVVDDGPVQVDEQNLVSVVWAHIVSGAGMADKMAPTLSASAMYK